MKVSAILKGKIDSNGHQSIYIRVNEGEKRTYHAANMKIAPSMFKDGKISVRHPKAREWNDRLNTLIMQHQSESMAPKKKVRMEFFEYLEQTIKHLTRRPGSLRQYGSQITKLKEYRPSFYTDQIDKEFLDGYTAFLKDRGNDVNTVWSSFKFLRKFVRQASKEGLIKQNPFDSYEFPKYVEPYKEYLTEEEVAKMDKLLQGEVSHKVNEAGTWFLIACETGLRISDIKNFSRSNIIGNRLVVRTQKTKEMVGLPISDKLKGYFERVNYKKPSMHEKTYNELIKIIAAAAGINKNISSHTARHTAAMHMANAGISQEVTAKILGQKDLRSTSTYYKISNKRIDMELKKKG